MSSTITIKRAVLLAMAEFTASAKDVIDANDYRAGISVRVDPNDGDEGAVLLAASNRVVLAVCRLPIGAEEGLVGSIELGKSWETGGDEYILPVVRILPALKGNPEDVLNIEHTTYGKATEEKRGKVIIRDDNGVSISTPTIPAMFDHLNLLTTVERGNLQDIAQIAFNPLQAMRFVRAAKKLGIPSPERVVLAFSGTAKPIGVKVGTAAWFYGVLMPIQAPGYGEGSAPGWLNDQPLTVDEVPEETEQLALWGDGPIEDESPELTDEEVYQRYSNATNDEDRATYAAEYKRRRELQLGGNEEIAAVEIIATDSASSPQDERNGTETGVSADEAFSEPVEA